LKQEVLDSKEDLEEDEIDDFNSLLESDSKSEVQSSSEPAELEYNLEGFDKLEKKLAEYIYSSLLGGLDLEETFQNGNMSITFDISDILKVDNLQMIGIDSENVEEVIDHEMAAA